MKKTQLLICLLVYCIPNIVLSQPSNDRHELIRQFVTFDAIYNKIPIEIIKESPNYYVLNHGVDR